MIHRCRYCGQPISAPPGTLPVHVTGASHRFSHTACRLQEKKKDA